jgi:hypothetical protein
MQAKADWTGNNLYDIRYFPKAGETTEAEFQFADDFGDWCDYNDYDLCMMSKMWTLGVKTFLLRSKYSSYFIDFPTMTQRNAGTGKVRKVRKKSDPLESYVKMCKEDPITASMLRDSADIFMCPILQDVPVVPVTASDGHMYDYDSIKAWMKQNDTSPMTKEKIDKALKPALRDRAVMQSIAKKNASSGKKRKLPSSKTASATSASSNE